MANSTLIIPEDLMLEIEATAARLNRTVTEVIRDAIRTYVESLDDYRLPRSFGMASDGSFDASKDEEYLAEHWARDIADSWGYRRSSETSSE